MNDNISQAKTYLDLHNKSYNRLCQYMGKAKNNGIDLSAVVWNYFWKMYGTDAILHGDDKLSRVFITKDGKIDYTESISHLVRLGVKVERAQKEIWKRLVAELNIAENTELFNENSIGVDESISVKISEINLELIRHLGRYPSQMLELPPFKFEMLVAELLNDMGYKVTLTPQTRDGNRDIFAVIKMPTGTELLTIVECKKYAQHRKIGIDIVERFLWTIRERDRANSGFLATTSFFSEDVKVLQHKYKWLLSLVDFDKLNCWLQNYGQWVKQPGGSDLWLPATGRGNG